MKLTSHTLTQLDSNIKRPEYNRSQTEIGIVHLGPGAFFRAHQAWYTEQALNLRGGPWGICAVALNSHTVKNQLEPQQGLYSLVELDKTTNTSVIGSVKEFLAYQQDFDKVLARLTAATTKLVTLTITEKGYYLNSDGQLDIENAIIQTDLAAPEKPQSAIGLLVLACQLRWQQKITPLSMISCDNVSDNGGKLKRALVAFSEKSSPQQINSELAQYIQQSVICPCTMVDSITPATDDELAKQIEQQFNYQDNWPVKREAFTQWVIEDILPDDIPAWREVGVTFTQDVAGYENAKLRVLNATHSTMAYLGCLINSESVPVETVYDAIHQEPIHAFISKMLITEIKPSFDVPTDMDFEKYCLSILQRYRNPAIKHLLSQIAWDGSQKLPVRILPVIIANLKNNRQIVQCCLAVAAWMRFIVQKSRDGSELIDPLKEELLSIGKDCQDEAKQDVIRFMSLSLFPEPLKSNSRFIDSLTKGYESLCENQPNENNSTELLKLLGTF